MIAKPCRWAGCAFRQEDGPHCHYHAHVFLAHGRNAFRSDQQCSCPREEIWPKWLLRKLDDARSARDGEDQCLQHPPHHDRQAQG